MATATTTAMAMAMAMAMCGTSSQLMADPEGRYFGLWQAQRAWAAEESTANGDGSGDTSKENISGSGSNGAPPP